ncbi:MAG: aminopeptidase P family protein [Candidatus Sumerlaeia bacterium]|nr:aminopeptidase P family protein [Candidatus Sumerlaeia bacterium]
MDSHGYTVHLARLERARARLKEENLDALVVLDGINIVYLCGFRASYAVLVVDAREVCLITDSRYGEAAERDLSWMTVKVQPGREVQKFLKGFFAARGYTRVGFEESISVEQHDKLTTWLGGCPLERAGGIVKGLRAIKDGEELARIRRAVGLADRMMENAFSLLRPGASEQDISRAIRFSSEELGGEGESFSNIVASGTNSSVPHHHPGPRLLAEGDAVTVDLGGIVDGYCSDLTRNPFLGHVPKEMERVYQVVLEANEAAIAAIRPGMTGVEVDAIAREIIDTAGYGAYFGHGLGHGVGLEIHEGPRLSPMADDTPLVAGNVVTIEPGVYIPGLGGVRIEDYILLGENGAEILSRFPRELAVLDV